MKLTFTKIIYTVLCLLFAFNSRAAIYTAATSGNYSNNSTWVGGMAPPANVGANNIVIGGGITVTLDVNLVVSSTFSLVQLQANGRIESTSSHYISLTGGQLTGDINSTIDVDSVYIGNTNISYNGTITGDKINFAGPNLPGNITIQADEYMYFTSGLTNLSSGSIIILATGSPTPTIVMDGGTFIITGANFNLTTPYNVRYQQPSVSIGSGAELTGSGLADIEIAVGAGNSVNLDQDLTVNGLLKLTSGSLALNFGNYKLFMAGNSSFDPGGTGTIMGSATSEIIITSTATNLGTVRFTNGSEVKNLEMKAANAAAELKLGSSLRVSGILTLQKGRINVQGNTLSIAGGIGSISGGSASSYIVTEANGQLKQDVPASSATIYPVGHASAYTPAVITDQKGAVIAEMSVNVQQGVKDQGSTGTDMAVTKPLVNATWMTSVAGSPTNLDYKLELQWAAASEVNSFDRSKSFVSQYDNNKWSNQAGTAAGTNGSMYSAQKSNVTSGGTFAVLDESTLSIDNIISGETISLYPNPAKNLLNITVSEMATATLYNTTGQVVLTAEIGKNNNAININHLPAGMYFVQLQGEETNGTARFVKE